MHRILAVLAHDGPCNFEEFIEQLDKTKIDSPCDAASPLVGFHGQGYAIRSLARALRVGNLSP